jgi:type IV pilus assembly protein PilQ
MLRFNLGSIILFGILANSIDHAAAQRLLIERQPVLKTHKKSSPTQHTFQQVLIKAHVVNIDRSYTHELGIGFGTSSGTFKSPEGFNINLPAADTDSGHLVIPIAEFSQGVLLEATLTALEKSGHAQLISDPQIITLDKQAAIIEAGQEVPYQQLNESGGTNVTFKKAVMRLQVTPEIRSPHSVLLHLNINQDQVSDLTVNGVPAINTQQLKTQVLMQNHDTLILGGVMQENKVDQREGIPFLSKIPYLGALFRYQKHSNIRKQLLIFVTPIILNESGRDINT